MKQDLYAAAFVAGFSVAPVAQAIDIGAGTAEYVTMRDCTVPGVSGCDDVSRVLFGQYGGLPGIAMSSARVSVPGYGFTSGSVSLSGVIGAPVLKAIASSEPGKRLNTNSAALQRYVYGGVAPTTRAFGGTVTYSQFSTGTYPPRPSAGIHAQLEIFSFPTSTISVEPTAVANFEMLSGGFASLSGFTSLGSANYDDEATTSIGLGNLSVTVNLDPGDAVWIWAFVQTPATNGGWVDASHTFVTAWDDPTGLVPTAVAAVPEPGTLALFLAGGVAVASAVRRRKVRRTLCAGRCEMPPYGPYATS